MSNILLLYCRENADLAERTARRLESPGFTFQHLTNEAGSPAGSFLRRVETSRDPVLLLLTDNFVKNTACMSGALELYQTLARQNRLLTVVADGKASADGGQTFEPVPTRFDRVVHAIQYMNFWQTAYLEKSAGLAQVPPEERPAYEADLETVRGIANEIGELFSALRDGQYFTEEQFAADNYALFFRHFNLADERPLHRTPTGEAELPPFAEPVVSRPLAETPVVSGPLIPAPSERQPTEQPAGADDLSFDGIDSLLHEIAAEAEEADLPLKDAPEQQPERSVLERLIETPKQDFDTILPARQAAQDAWFWLEKGHVERGLELFELALEQYPDDETLHSEYRRAQQLFSRAEPPPNGSPRPAEPPPAPEPPAADWNARNPSAEAELFNERGDQALSKGDFLFAKYCWDKVTELQPGYPGIYRKLALLTSNHLPDYKETAAHYLEEALNAEPRDADLHYRLALLLRDHLGEAERAQRHFQEAVVHRPEHAAAWLALARHCLITDDVAQAEALYRHALEFDPTLQDEILEARFAPAAPETARATAVEELDLSEFSELPAETPVAPEPSPTPRRAQPAEPLTVLITGATSGIGRATATLFAREGHRVILTGRRGDRLEDLKQELETDFAAEATTCAFDVRDPAAVQKALENLPEAWQEIDLLLNNAGLAKGLAPIHEGNLEHWETMIDTNLKGLLYVTRAVAPGMVRRRRGHIVNIGSSAGKEVYLNGNVYCATKFAVDALTRAIRLDLHTHNIRVSQVSPGHVEETEFALTRFDGDAQRARIYDDFQPLKASDVAEAIYFIATRPPHVNIQDIWLFGTQQASATMIDRSGRGKPT